MIALLEGVVISVAGTVVVLDVHGVGYELRCSRTCIDQLEEGSAARIIVHTEVKEDSITLYGFGDSLEKQVFLLLLKVKGIAARTASDIISQINKLELLRVIGAQDLARLQTLKGIGRKTAERILVELRDQVADYVTAVQSERAETGPVGGAADDAVAALQALGFSRNDAERSVAQAQSEGVSLEAGDLVRQALQYV